MLANQGYAAYANNKIMTASPAELTCVTLCGKNRTTFIEKATAIKVNVLMALKRKEGD